MASQSFHPKIMSSANLAGTGPEELIRLLIPQVARPDPEGSPPDELQKEEIILDIDVDGARYLLVRLPKAERSRVQLSPREQEIVRMVAQGHSNKIIADVLSISCWTVGTHLRRVFAKLGVGSRAAMVARLLENSGRSSRKSAAAADSVREEPAPTPPSSRLRSA